MTNENWEDRKRARGPENAEVDECVLKWFKQARDKKERNNISFKLFVVRVEVSTDKQLACGHPIEETPDKDIFNVD